MAALITCQALVPFGKPYLAVNETGTASLMCRRQSGISENSVTRNFWSARILGRM
ncbi:hypothetical protein SMC26_29065 [Actinomadura fulvescens]